MSFLRRETHIDFMKWSTPVMILSGILVLICLLFIVIKGFNYGIDFTGGTEVQIKFNPETKVAIHDLREMLQKTTISAVEVQAVGDIRNNEFLIRGGDKITNFESLKTKLNATLKQNYSQLSEFQFKSFTDAYVQFSAPVDETNLKQIFESVGGNDLVLKSINKVDESTHAYRISFLSAEERIKSALKESYGDGAFEIVKAETVGPKVGQELKYKGLYAVILTCFFILLYVAFRFSFKFAPGAIVALIHDVVIAAGVFSIFGLDFTLQIVAALLMVLGYSINDTVVIYDRVRENLEKYKTKTLPEVINLSVNQTLTRTILTNFTVLLVTVTLIFMGGPVLRDFAITLTIGIGVGTYSTVFIASPFTILLEKILKPKTAQAQVK